MRESSRDGSALACGWQHEQQNENMRPLFSNQTRLGMSEIGAAASAAVAVLALVSWTYDEGRTVACGPEYVPMAPLTAWLMVGLCAAMVLARRGAAHPVARTLAWAGSIAVATVSLAVVAGAFHGAALPFEEWLAPTAAHCRTSPSGGCRR